MGARLSNDELATRTREANRRRAERLAERQRAAGRTAVTIWLTTTTKAALTAAAATTGDNLNDTAERLLSAALAPSTPAPAPARTPSVDTLPLFDSAIPAPDDRLARILTLKREQPELSNYAIADRVGCSEATVRRELKRLKAEATV